MLAMRARARPRTRQNTLCKVQDESMFAVKVVSRILKLSHWLSKTKIFFKSYSSSFTVCFINWWLLTFTDIQLAMLSLWTTLNQQSFSSAAQDMDCALWAMKKKEVKIYFCFKQWSLQITVTLCGALSGCPLQTERKRDETTIERRRPLSLPIPVRNTLTYLFST